MEPVTMLIVSGQLTFLRQVSYEIEQSYGGAISVIGAVFRSSDALLIARYGRPRVVLVTLGDAEGPGVGLIGQLHMLLPRARVIAILPFLADEYLNAAVAAGADAILPREALHHGLVRVLATISDPRQPAIPSA